MTDQRTYRRTERQTKGMSKILDSGTNLVILPLTVNNEDVAAALQPSRKIITINQQQYVVSQGE